MLLLRDSQSISYQPSIPFLLVSPAHRGWREAAADRRARRTAARHALMHWGRASLARALNTWRALLAEARARGAIALEARARAQRRRVQAALRWWRDLAQYLHHHRVVLAYFRARRLRTDGAAALAGWRAVTADAATERRAAAFRALRLLARGLGAWLVVREAARLQRAAAHRNRALLRAALLQAWPAGVAAARRKRRNAAAAAALCAASRQRRALGAWAVAAYRGRLAKAALHFRVRRLGAAALKQWRANAAMVRDGRLAQIEIARHAAVTAATTVLADWRALACAHAHRRAALAAAALAGWRCRAAGRAAKVARLAEARAAIEGGVRRRAFFSWRWHAQLRALKELAFARKQRALRQALAMGERARRQRRAATLAAAFSAWRVRAGKYRRVAAKLAGLLEVTLRAAFASWRSEAAAARARRLRAERLGDGRALERALAAWRANAAAARARSEELGAAAEALRFATACGAALAAWRAAADLGLARRAALARAVLVAHEAAIHDALAGALDAWRARAAARHGARAALAAFVVRRRLEALAEYFEFWRQYAAAMRAGPATLILTHDDAGGGGLGPLDDPSARLSPMLSPRTAHLDRRLVRRMALLRGGVDVDAGSDDGAPSLLAGLPETGAAAAARRRAERVAAFARLSPGYRRRRETREGARPSYDDTAGHCGAGGDARCAAPPFDVRAAAESVLLAAAGRVPAWELPSVRSPEPGEAMVGVDELRAYRQRQQGGGNGDTAVLPPQRLAYGAAPAEGPQPLLLASDDGTCGGSAVEAAWERGGCVYEPRQAPQGLPRGPPSVTSSGGGSGGSGSMAAEAAAAARRAPHLAALGWALAGPRRRVTLPAPAPAPPATSGGSPAAGARRRRVGAPSAAAAAAAAGADSGAQPIFSLAAWDYVR